MTPLLGAFGSGGLCLCIAAWVIAGSRRKEKRGRLAERHQDHHTAWWMIIFGFIASSAGQAFTAPKEIGGAFAEAFTKQTAFGNVGPGAVAALLIIIIFATKPNVWKDSILGATLPSVMAGAGGPFAIIALSVGSIIHSVTGV